MGIRYDNLQHTQTIAVGIEVDRHSLCGAIKRFELNGKQWNGLLSLKEQCARRITLIKNEQAKCFMIAYLPRHLFEYVTEDIFSLQRDEFESNYPESFHMCQECTMDSYEKPSGHCRCPNMYDAIDALNKCYFKQVNQRKVMKRMESTESKQFELIYKIPNDGMDHSYEIERKDPVSCFLYLSPRRYENDYFDSIDRPRDRYYYIDSHISAEDKLLFIDAMRFFGGFRTDYIQPQLILYRRSELVL